MKNNIAALVAATCVLTTSCGGSRCQITPVSLSAGESFACAVTEAGGMTTWGGNNAGQLGNGSAQDSASAIDVVGF